MANDMSRQDATDLDIGAYSLSIEDAAERYEHAGHPRTARSIQRYCANGHLDARRIETPWGEKYLITPESLARHIAYIEEAASATTRRGVSRQDATDIAPIFRHDDPRKEPATASDTSRHVAAAAISEKWNDQTRQGETSPDVSRPVAADARYIEVLERENLFLHKQIDVKDTQIASLQERAHESNALVNGLQRLLAPLLGPRGKDERNGSARNEQSDSFAA